MPERVGELSLADGQWLIRPFPVGFLFAGQAHDLSIELLRLDGEVIWGVQPCGCAFDGAHWRR